MDPKTYFREQKNKMIVHLEQLRIQHRRLSAEDRNTLKLDRQIEREESRLALLEDIWDVQ